MSLFQRSPNVASPYLIPLRYQLLVLHFIMPWYRILAAVGLFTGGSSSWYLQIRREKISLSSNVAELPRFKICWIFVLASLLLRGALWVAISSASKIPCSSLFLSKYQSAKYIIGSCFSNPPIFNNPIWSVFSIPLTLNACLNSPISNSVLAASRGLPISTNLLACLNGSDISPTPKSSISLTRFLAPAFLAISLAIFKSGSNFCLTFSPPKSGIISLNFDSNSQLLATFDTFSPSRYIAAILYAVSSHLFDWLM